MTSPADSRLASPVVLITGASSGIGLALACVLASHRVALVLTARRPDALARVRDRLQGEGATVRVHACDVADADALAEAFASAQKLGALVGVVNNAGVLHPIGPVADLNLADFERHHRTNVLGVLVGTKLALRSRRSDQPLRVVNISSGAATRAFRGWAAYCSSKAAVNQLTEVAALESADGFTSIVSVAPGIIETAMQRTIREVDEQAFPDVGQFVRLKEEGQLLHPVDAAVPIAWLTLDAPLSMTGSFVDGRSEEVQAQVRSWLAARGEASAAALGLARGWFDRLEGAS